MKVIGYITSTVIIGIWTTILSGWAITKLWSWFMVTTFNLPILTIPTAIGLCLMLQYFQHTPKQEKDKEFYEILLEGLVVGTFKPLLYLGIGSIIRFWM